MPGASDTHRTVHKQYRYFADRQTFFFLWNVWILTVNEIGRSDKADGVRKVKKERVRKKIISARASTIRLEGKYAGVVRVALFAVLVTGC